ncbi:DUF2726 domain-containing protein [Acinetobacter chinensis]|uniref:DUF2726 domain-containing protein n=1 Tax=Acinetobacter chinensis TaxID=2004650 RepID=UPI00148C3F00
MVFDFQIIFIFIGCIATVAFILLVFGQHLFRSQQYHPKKIITPFEQKMFIRLNEAFPAQHVLAQVAFSALITSQNYKVRNRFNRKVTDFVILDQSMNVLAVIELDDPSHEGKEEEDALRDAMLHEAGYKVCRYTEIPTVRQLKQDIAS